MAHPAMDTLRAKVALSEWFTGAHGAGYAAAMAEVTSLRMARHQTPADIIAVIERNGDGAPYAAAMAKRLQFATNYWVESDMVDLVMSAAHNRPLEAITIADAPVQHGFALLDRAALITLVDSNGEFETINVKAFLWDLGFNADGQPGFSVVFWADAYNRADDLARDLAENKVDPFAGMRGLVVIQVAFIEFGRAMSERAWYEQWACTFWHLLDTTVVSTTPEEPDRRTRRQMERADIPANTVSIVTLRHRRAYNVDDAPERPDLPEEQRRRLTVRHWVGADTGGFWRNQPYGPNRAQRRLVWIAPFLKGPEDAPILLRKDRIYAWRR